MASPGAERETETPRRGSLAVASSLSTEKRCTFALSAEARLNRFRDERSWWGDARR